MKTIHIILLVALFGLVADNLIAQNNHNTIRVRKAGPNNVKKLNDVYTLEIFNTDSKLYKEYYLLKKFPKHRESYIDGVYAYDVGEYRTTKLAKDAAKKINKQGYATKLVYIIDGKRNYVVDK